MSRGIWVAEMIVLVEDVESAILRMLRDTENPVPVRELDDTGYPRAVVANALSRLIGAGVADVHSGHLSVSPSRVREEEPPRPAPTKNPARCDQCGELLTPNRRGRPRKFCSTSCQRRHWKARSA